MSTQTLILIAVAGFAAQLVDGGLGMGFGATSMTILTTVAAMAPATASAVVNTAQLGTTVVSGFAHWRFGNVNWKVVVLLGVPGAIGSFAGATLLSNISLDAARPLTAAILAGIGIFLLLRFSRGRVQRSQAERPLNKPVLSGLGLVGGFISASGGAGWGPVTTSALLASERLEPRRVVGTVNTAEFLVTVAAVIGFVFGLWEELTANLAAAVALLIGGVLGAPIAAWAVSRLNSSLLGGAVGTLLVLLNLPKLLDALGVGEPWTTAINAVVLVAGVLAAGVGTYRARRNRAALAADAKPAPGVEKAPA
ncbi:sulfite exporter TauE/SafE family protein [Corynebacterium guangdongense]|uniref:Probable membrane transporter protein n=1 Tax=Corynebacterium guangdongense TaxID=1783348 RepID=A0ABU2A2L7_9CORY|nr:sulfite exporter TauE/SafE family protein [Corynebacterium guangdongense]MDR7330318.1 putative membrane protein YfcA [Corynebacterium guangdongense]WJZ18876.1 Sulfite exporter TauE/SafE [Corynebacterium guangdongense]